MLDAIAVSFDDNVNERRNMLLDSVPSSVHLQRVPAACTCSVYLQRAPEACT